MSFVFQSSSFGGLCYGSFRDNIFHHSEIKPSDCTNHPQPLTINKPCFSHMKTTPSWGVAMFPSIAFHGNSHSQWVQEVHRVSICFSKIRVSIFAKHISGQIIIFHQPWFSWNKGISLTKPPFGVRSCEVAIIWPDIWSKKQQHLPQIAIMNVGF